MFFSRKIINPIQDHLSRIPPVLYKYRHFDQNNYGLQYALHGTVYFPSATELNDPFEAHFVPKSKTLRLKEKPLREFLRQKAVEHYPEANSSRIQDLVRAGLLQRELLINRDPRGFKPILDAQNNMFGILSLSAKPDSIPMWAYYADRHRGFCVGISARSIAKHQLSLVETRETLALHKVLYRRRMLRLDVDINSPGPTKKQLETIESTVYRKSLAWKHEEEYRLLLFKHPSSSYTFGSESVAEVVFGIHVDVSLKRDLIERIRSESPHIRLRQAIQSQYRYRINIIDL